MNYNAAIELGSMLVTGRRCAILKDTTAPNLPVNLSGQIYKAVDFKDLTAVREQAHLGSPKISISGAATLVHLALVALKRSPASWLVDISTR